jgi:hypothetical protein
MLFEREKLGCALYYSAHGSVLYRGAATPASFLQSLYFSTITFTTVGFGDLHPQPRPFYPLRGYVRGPRRGLSCGSFRRVPGETILAGMKMAHPNCGRGVRCWSGSARHRQGNPHSLNRLHPAHFVNHRGRGGEYKTADRLPLVNCQQNWLAMCSHLQSVCLQRQPVRLLYGPD